MKGRAALDEKRAEAPAGMRAAARRAELLVVPIEEGVCRVGTATVRVRDGLASCDCPMGNAPACLHRLARAGDAREKAGEKQHDAEVKETKALSWITTGERLPAEDTARFMPILDEVDALLAEMVTLGLRRAARVTLERTRALGARAAATRPRHHAPREAGLGRMTRALERLAALLPSLGGSDTGTAEARALGELAILRNLSRALRANTGALALADMAGASRSEYVEVPAFEVQGLGLEVWTMPGGAAGLTAYVAVIGGAGFGGSACVLARTVIGRSFSGQTKDVRALGEGLASGPAFAGSGATMRDLARGRFSLSGGRVAKATGKLSGSGTTSAAALPPVPLDDPRLAPYVLSGPEDAVRLGKTLLFDPLGRPPPSLPIALLPVRSLSPTDFDPATQRLTLRMRTTGGASLSTSLVFREDRGLFFDNLEVVSRAVAPPRWLCVRLARDGGELAPEPLTAFFEARGALDLTLDVLGRELEETAS